MDYESGYEEEVADVLAYALIGKDKLENDNVIDALDSIGKSIVRAAELLGNNDAATSMGALEAHGKCILDAADRIAGAIETLAQTIEETFGPRA